MAHLQEKPRWCSVTAFLSESCASKNIFCMPINLIDTGSCIVGVTSNTVKIPSHKLILNQIFVKPGLCTSQC